MGALDILGILGTLPSVPASGACAAYRRARDHESRRPLRIRQSLKKSELREYQKGQRMIMILKRPSGVDIDGHFYEREHTD